MSVLEDDPYFRAQLRRAWIRWVSAIVIAVAVSYGLVIISQRDNDVAGCVRGAERAAIQIRFFADAARKNRDTADIMPDKKEAAINIKAANGYESDADDMVETIPPTYPYSWQFTADRDNTDAVSQEIKEACKEAFPPPIPNVS
jgi:hypothetical protein